MVKLNKSGVVFNEADHTYFLGDKQLQGITGVIHDKLFPDMYKGISKEVLNNAAARGTYVHKMCEAVDNFGATPIDCPEAMNHIKLVEKHSLESVACEYLVTDREHFASAIDAIYMGGDDTVDLCDRKTTSKLNKEYISWQLSIYAYLFEMQNPHIKVGKLYAEWLRGSVIAELVEVERKPVDRVKALLEAYVNDTTFEVDNDTPSYISAAEDTLIRLDKQIKELTAQYNEVKKELEASMQADGIETFVSERATYTLVKPTTSLSFDSAKFKDVHPDMYEKYQKTTTKKGFIKITIKK